MIFLLALAILLGSLGLIFLISGQSKWYLLFAALALMVFSYPRNLVWLGNAWSYIGHSDIATPSATLTTYCVALVAVLLIFPTQGCLVKFGLEEYMFLSYLGIMLLIWWPADSTTIAGVLQLATAILAWKVGRGVSALLIDSGSLQKGFVVIFSVCAVAQVTLAILQVAGVDFFNRVSERTALNLEEGRASGTLDHPDSLGKLCFFLLVMLLPFSTSTDLTTKMWSAIGSIASLIAIGLSEGRAAIVAAVVLVVFWFLLSPALKGDRDLRNRSWSWLRTLVLVALAILGYLGFQIVKRRTLADPGGGARSHFMDVAMDVLPNEMLAGLGPNRYVLEVGQVDPLTGLGWPVHNTFVLAIAEIGVLGFVLMFWPMALAFVRVAKKRVVTGIAADARVVYLGAIPGVVIIGWTGWGLLGTNMLSVWFLSFGLVSGLCLMGPQGNDSIWSRVENSGSRSSEVNQDCGKTLGRGQ